MKIFDASITGSLEVAGNGHIAGNLTVDGVINASISGTTSNAVSASHAASYTLTSSFGEFTSSYRTGSFTGSFKGDGNGLYNIPASGVTGLSLDQIASGANTASIDSDGLQINTDTSITGALNVSGSVYIKDNLYVSGNVEILGSSSLLTLSASQVEIGTNTIILNTYAPFERFAGISVYDSGSNVGVTGSLLWDSQNNVWLYSNPSGSNYASAKFISGPKNTGSLGDEQGLTVGYFPIASGDDHISDSLLRLSLIHI